jgi:hypothetical protein
VKSHQREENQPVVFISHGNYVLDKPLLECEFGRQGIVVPSNWFFYDTLSWFRTVFKKQPSYSLKNLYEYVFSERIPNQHFALPDTKALYRLLSHTLNQSPIHTSLHGVYYPAYYTPLQRVKFLGNYNERLLVNGGIQCVEDLHMLLLHKCRLNVDFLEIILREKYHLSQDSAEKIASSVLHLLLCPKY